MTNCPSCNLVYCRCSPPGQEESSETIFDLVRADLAARDAKGRETYGGPLLPWDGRNSLWDAYEEALDLAMYLRKKIREETGR